MPLSQPYILWCFIISSFNICQYSFVPCKIFGIQNSVADVSCPLACDIVLLGTWLVGFQGITVLSSSDSNSLWEIFLFCLIMKMKAIQYIRISKLLIQGHSVKSQKGCIFSFIPNKCYLESLCWSALRLNSVVTRWSFYRYKTTWCCNPEDHIHSCNLHGLRSQVLWSCHLIVGSSSKLG
jgi:hypothetical protein